MDLGVAVFGAGVLVSLAIIYAATKDRWNWRRITLGCVGLLVLGGSVAGAGAYWFVNRTAPVVRQESLLGLSLGTSREDVLFRKGTPDREDDEESFTVMVYDWNTRAYSVHLDSSGEVISILAAHCCPSLMAITSGSSYDKVLETVGSNFELAERDEGRVRVLRYAELQVLLLFGEGKVAALGVYKPGAGDSEDAIQ